jgi:cytochrome P450 family 144
MNLDLADPELLLSDGVLADPRPLYDVLRREAPVWRIPGQDSYLVTDPALIRDVVARPAEFSSNLVSVLHRDDSGRLISFEVTPFGDSVNILATADPPVHTRHRRLLQPHLNPTAIRGLEPVLIRIVEEQLAPLLADGRGDFVTGFSDPVPARAICEVIGLPSSDAPRLVKLVAGIGALLDGVTDLDGMGQAAAAALELLVYAQEHRDAALDRPSAHRVGLLAVLVDAIAAGDVSPDEARDLMVLLINAGTETTSSLIATAVNTLARNADLQEHLRAHPERISDSIEDFLREDGPFQFHYRWTTTDTVIGDHRIPAHSRVLLMWAAANRPSPDGPADVDPNARGLAPHFAFGRGLHFCIGAHLARLEVRTAIERLLARTTAFALDPDEPPSLRPSIFLRRHTSLPVVVEAA